MEGNLGKKTLLICILVFFGSCSHPKKDFGPMPPVGPKPFRAKPIVLVLGPGMARGFAHAGVLQTLQEEDIPVAAIVAVEMGALVGAIYATSESPSDFAWKLLKFEKRAFESDSYGFVGRETRFDTVLAETIGNRHFDELKVPLYIVGPFRGKVQEIDDGLVKDAIRSSLYRAPFYTRSNDQTSYFSAYHRFPLEIARRINMGPIVQVVVLEERTSLLLPEQIEIEDSFEPDLVIHPNLDKIKDLDFNKKATAVFRGKKATRAVLNKLRKIVND